MAWQKKRNDYPNHMVFSKFFNISEAGLSIFFCESVNTYSLNMFSNRAKTRQMQPILLASVILRKQEPKPKPTGPERLPVKCDFRGQQKIIKQILMVDWRHRSPNDEQIVIEKSGSIHFGVISGFVERIQETKLSNSS